MNDYTQYRLDDVRVVLLDAQPSAKNILRGLLYDLGFRDIRVLATIAETRETIVDAGPELLIADTQAPDGDVCDLVREIRHGDCGDPFLPVLMLTWRPTEQEVKRVIGAGSDVLMTMPTSKGKMITAIESLIRKRKPFVVTTDYIGPDRRGEGRGDDNDMPVIKVPNPMRVKATGEPEAGDHNECLNIINHKKVEHDGSLIGSLAKTVVAHYGGSHPARDIRLVLERLRRAAGEMQSRIHDTKYAHQGELCKSLASIAERIAAKLDKPADRDIELLKQVALAIAVAVKDETGGAAAAMDIAREIGSAPRVCVNG